jgi:hypothetical protein
LWCSSHVLHSLEMTNNPMCTPGQPHGCDARHSSSHLDPSDRRRPRSRPPPARAGARLIRDAIRLNTDLLRESLASRHSRHINLIPRA